MSLSVFSVALFLSLVHQILTKHDIISLGLPAKLLSFMFKSFFCLRVKVLSVVAMTVVEITGSHIPFHCAGYVDCSLHIVNCSEYGPYLESASLISIMIN